MTSQTSSCTPDDCQSAVEQQPAGLQNVADIPEDERVVLVIGKTGDGKSSLAGHLTGQPEKFPVGSGAGQKTSICSSTNVHLRIYGRLYNLKVIDTPGYLHAAESACRDQLKKVKDYIQEHAPDGVNTVLIVMKAERYKKCVADSLKLMQTDMKLDKTCFALAFTGCENWTEEEAQEEVEEFLAYDQIRNIAKLIRENEGDEKRYITVGFPKITQGKPELKKIFEKEIAKDVEKLRKFVILTSHFREKKLKDEIFNSGFWRRLRVFLHSLFG